MLKLRTRLRDCLFLNWACAVDEIPPPPLPEGLRLDTRRQGERPVWLVSAVLFRQEGLRLRSLPFLRFSYPQANLRTYVIDADGQPAVYFLGMWVPAWVVPGVRLLAGQPAVRATFAYPSAPFRGETAEWTVIHPASLRARVEPGAAAKLEDGGAVFPSWEARCSFFRERAFGYVRSSGRVSRIVAQSSGPAALPVRASIAASDLVARTLGAPVPALESAMLYPEIRFLFHLAPVPQLAVPTAAPAPV
jgi:hypothetical protein